MIGRPRYGHEYMGMRKTRAQFKLALRYCKQHEEMIRADAYATSLTNKDYNKFWSSIKKSNNDKTTKIVNAVGGCSGDNDIAEMWMRHYKQLYNSVDDGGAKETFYRRVATNVKDSKSCEITVLDVAI